MKRSVQWGLWLLALIGLTARAWTMAHLSADSICGNDFPGLWAGGRLLGTPYLYSSDVILRLLQQVVGCTTPSGVFVRPPFVAVLLWPLGQLEMYDAKAAWLLASLAALVVFLYLWPAPKPVAAALVCWALPVSAVLTQGQDTLFLLLWIGIAAALLVRGHEFAAGMVLALCAAKIHLFFMLPVLLVGRRMWRPLWGLLAGGVVLAAVSVVAAGWNWPVEFLRMALGPQISPHPWLMPNLRGMLFGAGEHWGNAIATTAEIALSLAVAYMVWIIARSAASLRFALAATLIGGLLTSRHAYVPDVSLLLPAALTFPFEAAARWVRLLAILVMLPVVYFLTAIPALTWAPPLLILLLLVGAAVASTPPARERPTGSRAYPAAPSTTRPIACDKP